MKNEVLPNDFSSTVKDIKLAILQARAKAAHLANAEALKLYFFVGGFISKKTRNAKWGSGAINALSERLQVELPGLKGFSATSMKKMRLFFEAWASCVSIRPLSTDELTRAPVRHLPSVEIRPMPLDELEKVDIAAFFSIGFTHHREIIRFCKGFDERFYYIRACAKEMWSGVQLAVQGYSQPIGIATYQALRNIPEPYKMLAPVIDGVRRVLAESAAEKQPRKRTTRKGITKA